MQAKTAVCIGFFVVFLLLLTRFDYFVNHDLYLFGLQFNTAWYIGYSLLYFGFYQAVIWALFYNCRNYYFLFLTQIFCITSTQDIVYFYLWGQGMPPATQVWEWSSGFIYVFGTWNTNMQFMLSATSLAVASLAVIGIAFYNRKNSGSFFFRA